MSFEYETLIRLRHQDYSGTKRHLSRSLLDRFTHKEFHNETDIAEIFHENTKLPPQERRPQADDTRAPDIQSKLERAVTGEQPGFRDNDSVQLPEPNELTELCQKRDGEGAETVSLQIVADVLSQGFGVTERESVASTPLPVSTGNLEIEETRRTYRPVEGLYATEARVAVLTDSLGVNAGLYAYDGTAHELAVIQERPPEGLQKDCDDAWRSETNVQIDGTSIVVFITTTFWRKKINYDSRGYRFALLEAGQATQSMTIAASLHDVPAQPSANFIDESVNDLLGINGVEEAAIHSLVLGTGGERE